MSGLNFWDLADVFRTLASRASPEERLYFTASEFKIIEDWGLIVDCSHGGLLMAPSHANGGIQVFNHQEGLYRCNAEFEGWEYIINPKATEKHKQQIDIYNKVYHKDWTFEEYEVQSDIRMIDASPIAIYGANFNRYLLHPGPSTFIVNKHATKNYLSHLNHLNNNS